MGGVVMGISMADIGVIDVDVVEDDDPHIIPLGARGISRLNNPTAAAVLDRP
jgi:hypothetical protein